MSNNSRDIRKELDELGSSLSGMSKNNTPSPPAHYFEILPDKMMRRVKEIGVNLPENSLGPSLWKWLEQLALLMLRPQLAILSIIVLVLFVAFLIAPDHTQNKQEISWNNVSASDIDAYIADNMDAFEEDAFFESALSAIESDGLFSRTKPESVEEFIKQSDVLIEEDFL